MALVLIDRAQETTTTTGTGTLTLAGAVAGYQSLAGVGNGNTTYFCTTDGTNWEVALGTYTSAGTTLSRTTILASSNAGAAVNWGAGSKNVFCCYPAGKEFGVDGGTLLGALILAAGTTALAPLKLQSGSLLTSVTQGALEYDGVVAYLTALASQRGVIPSEQIIMQSAAYTLTSTTSAQQMFNASAAGAVTVSANTTYMFEGLVTLSSLSATSGTFSLGHGGTATITSCAWESLTIKPTSLNGTANNVNEQFWTAMGGGALNAGNTNTLGAVRWRGAVRINAGGTLIPQVSLGVAAAAIVGAGSFFKLSPIGSGSVVSVGNWS